MKLFTKYNRVLVLVFVAGLLCMGYLFYRTLGNFLDQNLDDGLDEELLEVQDFTHVKNITPAPSDDENLFTSYQKAKTFSTKRTYGDTIYYNPKKHITESARYLKAVVNLNGKPLATLIMVSKAEEYEQIKSIGLAIFIPMIILFGILIWVNRYLLSKQWQPFRSILQQMQEFNLNYNRKFNGVETNITEFQELNTAVSQMIHQIKDDFREVKLFTENASHEMMTPIAIINTKLDTLLQSPSLQEENSVAIHEVYKATARLNKINQSLLLLVKIDHNLVNDQQNIDVKAAINNKAEYFGELLQNMNLLLIIEAEALCINFSKHLFDIILNNLFSNAIRHNTRGGKLIISVEYGCLTFMNTSNCKELDKQRIFERFYKDSASEGTGLGLSILQQICKKHQLELRYQYTHALHQFSIDFSSVMVFVPPFSTNSALIHS